MATVQTVNSALPKHILCGRRWRRWIYIIACISVPCWKEPLIVKNKMAVIFQPRIRLEPDCLIVHTLLTQYSCMDDTELWGLCRATTTCTCKVSSIQFYCLFLLQLFNSYYSLYYIQSNPADIRTDFLKQRYRFWVIQVITWSVGPTRIIIRLRLLITCTRRTDGNGTNCQFRPSKTHTVWEAAAAVNLHYSRYSIRLTYRC